jgi:transposase
LGESAQRWIAVMYWFSVNWNLPRVGLAVRLPTEVRSMSEQRKHYPAPDKVAILRLHLLEKKPVSDLCDEFDITPNLFYRWQRELFENGAAAFENHGKRHKASEDAKDRKIAALEQKLRQKNEVLAEVMQEYVLLKKELGEP